MGKVQEGITLAEIINLLQKEKSSRHEPDRLWMGEKEEQAKLKRRESIRTGGGRRKCVCVCLLMSYTAGTLHV